MKSADIDKIIGIVKSHRGIVVLRSFPDYDAERFWLLDMTGPELERWWEAQEEFWLASGPKAQQAEIILARIFGEPDDPPPLRPPMRLPGRFLPGWSSGEDTRLSKLWCALHNSGEHYYCEICCNIDSFLAKPYGGYVLHKKHPERRAR